MSTTLTRSPARTGEPTDRVALAAGALYDAETALHAARRSGVDPWVAAASDALHRALVAYVKVVEDAAASVTGQLRLGRDPE